MKSEMSALCSTQAPKTKEALPPGGPTGVRPSWRCLGSIPKMSEGLIGNSHYCNVTLALRKCKIRVGHPALQATLAV